MKEYEKAMETYQEGLKHDPQNQELLDGVKRWLDISFYVLVSHQLLSSEVLRVIMIPKVGFLWGVICIWLYWFFFFLLWNLLYLVYSRQHDHRCRSEVVLSVLWFSLATWTTVFLQMCGANKQGKPWRSNSRGTQRETGIISLHCTLILLRAEVTGVMVTLIHLILWTGQGNAGSRNSEHPYRPSNETGNIWSSRVLFWLVIPMTLCNFYICN